MWREAKWEFLSGLFGWIWIAAGLTTLVFIVLTVSSNWDWRDIAYASVVSATSKWLARGFEDHKRRVFFEAKMTMDGMNDREAGAAWIKAYTEAGR
jgi:hypothetical protein